MRIVELRQYENEKKIVLLGFDIQHHHRGNIHSAALEQQQQQ